jgi:hypothetical protein
MKLKCGERSRARAVLNKYAARLIALGAAMTMAACATISPDAPSDAKQAAVKKRVEARWAALIKGDAASAYKLLSPASKAVVSERDFSGRMRRTFTGVEIESIDCAAESCDVKIFITYDTTPIKGIRTPARETWVLDKGDYWYVWPN